MDPTNLGQHQRLVADNPLAYVAAFFAIAFFMLLVHHLRAASKHYTESKAMLKDVTSTLHVYGDLMADIRILAYEARTKRERLKARNHSHVDKASESRTEVLVLPAKEGGKP